MVGSIYGWKRANGKRRFRVCWLEFPRKNGKTTLVYPAALFGLTLDGEEGAEVYSVATKRDQAKLVFDLCRAAAVRVEELAEVIEPYRNELRSAGSLAKMEALSADADTLDGLSPSCVIADEVHKWRGRLLWDVIETGMGAREQPLLLAITTAGEEGSADVYGQEHDYTEQVLEGVIEDDSRFGYIARIDPEDEYTDERCWVKANPNLGVSVQVDQLRDVVSKAKNSPAAVASVKRLHFNVREQDGDAWIPLGLWDRGLSAGASWEAFRGWPCFGGLDLASTCDFAAFCGCFPADLSLENPENQAENGPFWVDAGGRKWVPAADLTAPGAYFFAWKLWIPGESEAWRGSKLREIVRPWVREKWVEASEGSAIDHTRIMGCLLGTDEVEGIRSLVDLRTVAYDPYNAGPVALHLQGEGIEVAKFPQSMSQYAGPTKAFEEIILGDRFKHDGNPAARWMARNAVYAENGAGHRMPSRKRSRNKIDGVIAAVMALGAAVAGADSGERKSFYDTNGVEVL